MRIRHLKNNLVSHTPFFDREHFAWEFRHMMRDGTFWGLVILALVAAGLTLLVGYEIWSGQPVEPIRQVPMWPYY